MTDREKDVLAVLTSPTFWQPSQIARLLNLEPDGAGGYRSVPKCAWCPVLPPIPPKVRPARVPRSSLEKVRRALKGLVRDGAIEEHVLFRGKKYYSRVVK